MTIARTIGRGAIGSPLEVPGCQLWLDAADSSTITSDGNGVSQWNDKSGNAWNASQSTNTQKPIYTNTRNGNKIVTFDGSNDVLIATGAQLMRNVSGWTVFLALQWSLSATASWAFFINAAVYTDDTERFGPALLSSGKLQMGARRLDADAGSYDQSTRAFPTEFCVYSVVGDYVNTVCTSYTNGSQFAQKTSWLTAGNSSNTYGGLKVGGLYNSSNSMNGSIGEAIVYNSALSDTTRQRVERYLRNKWGTS